MAMADKTGAITVGYALPTKKVPTLITPTLLTTSHHLNIHFLPLNPTTSLLHQPHFDCLLHKLYSPAWTHNLLEFHSQHPHIPIIDPPGAIQRLHNRVSMLDFIHHLPSSPLPNISFDVPRQVVVDDEKNGHVLEDTDGLEKMIVFPVVAKPLVADGSKSSHEMALVFHAEGARTLRPPLVLQEFVDHGGVVFKVYVAGDHVRCVKRRSLPDASPEMESKAQGGILSFSQISNMADNDGNDGSCVEEAEMPAREFVEFMGQNMRQALGLNLFNFDMIRDQRVSASDGDRVRYLVIDINYFPGYAKLPDFEEFFTEFLCDVVKRAREDKDANLQHDGDGGDQG